MILLRIAANWLLRVIFEYIRPYLEKLCSLDYDIFKPPFFDVELAENNEFSPSIAADSFGSPSESGSSLYDVQLAIDINVLIDLSGILTRDIVYSKFADEYSLEKSQTTFSEISKFLSDISYSIDLYELASLLRGVATESTINSLLDSISLTDVSFKKLFSDSDDVVKLFIFLSNYCDYRICYDILGRSLEKYVGNICTPQQSRKKDYELILKDIGADPAATIRDQIQDLEKQFDQLCSTKFNLNIDVFKDGPKLLANYLTQFMVMPFGTIIEFQQKVYDYEKGIGMSEEQKKIMGGLIFKGEYTLKPIIQKFNSTCGGVKSAYVFAPISSNNLDSVKKIKTYKLSKTDKYTSDFAKRKQELKNYLNNLGVNLTDEVINKKIEQELYTDPSIFAFKLYQNLTAENKLVSAYDNIVYSVNYLEKLKLEIEEQVNNSSNIDVKDDVDLFNSYIDKLKE
jgi:hypothetical protein